MRNPCCEYRRLALKICEESLRDSKTFPCYSQKQRANSQSMSKQTGQWYGFQLKHFLVFCLYSFLLWPWWFPNFVGIDILSPQRPARCVSNSAKGLSSEELVNLRKRELLEILRGYEISTDGMTKQEVIDAIQKLQKESEKPQSTLETSEMMPDMDITQRGVAEIAMDEWQKASTVGFDCKSGCRAEDGVDLDILGPDGQVQHIVSFRHAWPPSCTCDDAQRWGSQRRCKHVCMILVKCGVPYAAVADSNWKPDKLEVNSIVDHMLGPWTPIPLATSQPSE